MGHGGSGIAYRRSCSRAEEAWPLQEARRLTIVSGRAVLLALSGALALTSCADDPNKFALDCRGVTLGSDGSVTPRAFTTVIDLSEMTWCEGECVVPRRILRRSGDVLVLDYRAEDRFTVIQTLDLAHNVISFNMNTAGLVNSSHVSCTQD